MLTTFPHSPYNEDYISFDPANYVQNPIALARIRAPLSREELAQRLGISVSYLGKIERSTQVREKMLARVKGGCRNPTVVRLSRNRVTHRCQPADGVHVKRNLLTGQDNQMICLQTTR